MWELPEDGVVGHMALGRRADLVILVPATANTLARIAAGLSDDLLTTTVLATTAPVLCVPAMNPQMYANSATQANIATLRQRGLSVLRARVWPYGRADDRPRALAHAGDDRRVCARAARRARKPRGRRVVVSAGGTHEPIDPVRFIGNRASGRMGLRSPPPPAITALW